MTTTRTKGPGDVSAGMDRDKTTVNQDRKRNSISRRAVFGIAGGLAGGAAASSAVATPRQPDPKDSSAEAGGPTPHQRAYYSKARF
jgi:hypothetical protein